MEVSLVHCSEDPERLIELAYLTCRNPNPWKPSNSKRTKEDRINDMWERKHFSPFEFADATFYIKGVSRACSHQFVRHRLASYEQLSMRHAQALGHIVPASIYEHKDAEGTMIDAMGTYIGLLSRGIEKEDARFVLPIGSETRFTAKMNFRSWIHFLHLRTDEQAQWEIRNVADHILQFLRSKAPTVFDMKYKDLWGYV